MYPCVSHTAPMKEYTHIHVHTHGKHTHANKETHTDSNMYIPNECSVHTMLRVIVNIAVAAGVISTNYITCTISHRIFKKKEYNFLLKLCLTHGVARGIADMQIYILVQQRCL